MKKIDSTYRAKLRAYEKYGSFMKSECLLCGANTQFFYDRYDAVCCLVCNKWFGTICEDINCPFCVNRPDTPLEALAWEAVYDDGQSSGGKDWRRKNYQHKNAGQMRHRKRQALYAELQDECKDL